MFFWFQKYKKNVEKEMKILSYFADVKLIIGGIGLIIIGLIMVFK
jgi:uncharacterized membrane protein SirB2